MTHQTANFGNLIYDSTRTGQQRVGTSATEIELLDDVPLTSGNSSKSQFLARPVSTGASRDQQAVSSTSPLPKETSRIIYANHSDEALGSAVDRLLERYAPDALPSKMYNTSTTRRPLSQQEIITTNTETLRSTFQTTSSVAPPPPPPPAPAPAPVPPSSTASHNYSTIIRPNRGATVQTPEDYSSQPIRPTPSKIRPVTNYDSFQHVAPQIQQSNPIPMQLKNGNVPPIVPGQLYSLDDDPLDLIYDRQAPSQIPPPRPPPLSKQAKPTIPSTFQPGSRQTNFQDPLTAIFPDLAQTTMMTTTTTATIPAPAPVLPAFNLGNLIKQVQQDYLHEIQPFVSSVKFIDKDHELGQDLGDVNFSTPVTVRKGFLDKADDLLRRSFGRQDHSRRFPEKKQETTNDLYSDEDDDQLQDLPSKNRYSQLQKLNSKASTVSTATTITSSVVTDEDDDDDDDDDVSEDSRPAHVVDQSTSPPPKEEPTKTLSGFATKTSPTNDKTNEDIRPIVPTLARRVPSDEQSDSSLESDSDEEDHENEKPTSNPVGKPAGSIGAVATAAPIVKPNDNVLRRQAEEARLATERSDDIHPTPPTIKSDVSNEKPPEYQRRPIPESPSEDESDSQGVTDSDEETPVTNSRNPPSAVTGATATATTTNSRFPTSTATAAATGARGAESATTSLTNSRFPAATTTTSSTPTRGTEPVTPTTTNSRFPATTTATPSRSAEPTSSAATNNRFPAATTATPSRGTDSTAAARATSSNVRGEPAGNPNLPFVSPDRRNPTSASGQPSGTPQTPSQGQGQSGSARLFGGSTESKSTRPAGGTGTQRSSFRDRLKGIKSRLFGK